MTSPRSTNSDSRAVAAALLDAGCVTARRDEPFRLPSGWASPVYIDCRRLISFPALRKGLVDRALQILKQNGALDEVKAVAGGEASGIALAAWIAQELELPLLYVRKKSAGQTQVEGVTVPDDKILLVDDMMASAQSKLRFVKALSATGAQVQDLFIVFDYGTFPTEQLLAPHGIRVHSLATWADILAVAQERGDLDERTRGELKDFLDDPAGWSQSHGGIAQYHPRADS